MILFLAANYELISQTILAIRRAGINSYVPKRLSDLRSFTIVDVLNNGGSDDDGDYFKELEDDGVTSGIMTSLEQAQSIFRLKLFRLY